MDGKKLMHGEKRVENIGNGEGPMASLEDGTEKAVKVVKNVVPIGTIRDIQINIFHQIGR